MQVLDALRLRLQNCLTVMAESLNKGGQARVRFPTLICHCFSGDSLVVEAACVLLRERSTCALNQEGLPL